jgi:signal transduction histidine kinase
VPTRRRFSYADQVVIDKGRPLWVTSRATDPPGPSWRDWCIVSIIVLVATIETLVRNDVVWVIPSLVTTVGVAFLLPWRRVHPMSVVLIAFGTMSTGHAVALLQDVEWEGLHTALFLLSLPYALTRWASGREIGFGLLILSVPVILTASGGAPMGDIVGSAAVLSLACAIGFAVRYSVELRAETVAGLRSREREELARELHDTVAHHVSAIAVRAQAGRVMAATQPEAAADALAVIEEEAGRALEEMRSMVGTLRRGDQASLRPQQGVKDLYRLEQHNVGNGPQVVVTVAGKVDGLRSAVDVACFRLAQEAVTNALRHAREASKVQVQVEADDDCIRLTVVDDGRGAASSTSTAGFGLVGMAERANLLGGTFAAGPSPDGGWTVTATLPRHTVTT